MPIPVFSHLSTIIHRKHNLIHYILNDDDEKIENHELIAENFIKFYINHFSSTSPSFPSDFQVLIQSSVKDSMNQLLNTTSSMVEVYKAIFSTDKSKSPGHNGMSPLFYRKYWHIVGKDVYNVVDDFFQNVRLNVVANHIFLTLIPKRQGAHRVDQFRPIDMAVMEDMAKAYDKVMKDSPPTLKDARF